MRADPAPTVCQIGDQDEENPVRASEELAEDTKKEMPSPQSFLALLHCDFTLALGWPVKNEAAP